MLRQILYRSYAIVDECALRRLASFWNAALTSVVEDTDFHRVTLLHIIDSVALIFLEIGVPSQEAGIEFDGHKSSPVVGWDYSRNGPALIKRFGSLSSCCGRHMGR